MLELNLLKMKRYIAALLFTAILCFDASAQQTESRNIQFDVHKEHITAEALRTHLEILASDSLMGRGTGQKGKEMAVDYLAAHLYKAGFPKIGEENTFFQHFDLKANRMEFVDYTLTNSESEEEVWSARAKSGEPASFSTTLGGQLAIEGDIVFGGFGLMDDDIGINHMADVTASGNWVLVFGDVPSDVDGMPENINELVSNRVRNLFFRSRATGILVINHFDIEEYEEESLNLSRLIGKPTGIRLPERGGRGGFAAAVKSVSPEMAVKLLGLESKQDLKNLHAVISNDVIGFRGAETGFKLSSKPSVVESVIPSVNIMGFLEGCHEELKDEIIVLSAHYDHMGIGAPDETGDMIYNGADDNGSGTVTTLLLAEVLKEAQRQGDCLDRSLLFLFVAAEEHGLLGSRYYSDNPVFPIENTVANFNLDMFGRVDYEYEETDDKYIYIIGAEIISSTLDSLLHVANERSVNINLDMRYNDLDDRNQFYRRSDHWNFGRLGVPFIFFFSGLHDNYHQPSDTVDLIAFDQLEKRAQLIYTTLIEVANAPERPVVDNQEFINRTRQNPR